MNHINILGRRRVCLCAAILSFLLGIDHLKAETKYIYSAQDLRDYANQINSEKLIDAELMNDIDISSLYANGNDICIGLDGSKNSFRSKFNGNGHTISGVKTPNRRKGSGRESGDVYYYGLFGRVNGSENNLAVIQNLRVQGDIVVNDAGNINMYAIGGVVAMADYHLLIRNVISEVNITFNKSGQKVHIGGIVGTTQYSSTGRGIRIEQCINLGTIKSNGTDAMGGIVGYIKQWKVIDCLNAGTLEINGSGWASGIVGYENNQGGTGFYMCRCLNVGMIQGSSKNRYALLGAKETSDSRVSDLFYKHNTAVEIYHNFGSAGSLGNKCTGVDDDQLRSGEVAYKLNNQNPSGWDWQANIWRQNLTGDNIDPYPVPDQTHAIVYKHDSNCNGTIKPYYNNSSSSDTHIYDERGICTVCHQLFPNPTISGAGTEANPYQIDSYVKLVWMVNLSKAEQTGKYFVLTKDIVGNREVLQTDANGKMSLKSGSYIKWEPKDFYGILDGQGHSISGIYCNQNTTHIGFFSQIWTNSVVKNLILRDSYFKGSDYFGSFCYYNAGTISNCASICLLESYQRYPDLGGICDVNHSVIQHCYSLCQINVENSDYAYEICRVDKCKNCYSLNRGINACGDRQVSEEDFRSGKVAYLLNSGQNATVWYQTLGEDAYPVFDATHGTVYGYTVFCGATECDTFSNDSDAGITRNPHQLDDRGYCTVCHNLDESPAAGTGTEADPYQIDNYAKFVWMNNLTQEEQTGKYFVLTADIVNNREVLEYDADGQMSLKSGIDFIEWTPKDFYGILDGQGHSISGIYFNNQNSITVGLGLFTYINSNSVVKNIILFDSYFKGKADIGSFCYRNYGTISNCASICLLEAYGSNPYIGGICDINSKTVEHCYSMSQMNVNGTKAAYEICRSTAGKNCYSIAHEGFEARGANIMTEEDFRSGKVTYLLNKGQDANVWHQTLGEDAYPVLDVTHGTVYGYTLFCGATDFDTFSNDGDAGITRNPHQLDDRGICTVCHNPDERPAAGTGTEADPYQIDNYAKLVWMAKLSQNEQTGKYFVLTKDIVGNREVLEYYTNGKMSLKLGIDFIQWPTNKFYGILDGQGHSISGIYVNKDVSNVGLFTYINRNSVIKNTILCDSYFRGSAYVGSFCCYNNYGTITNCASICLLEASGSGSPYIGGICYYNSTSWMYNNSIEHCYSLCQMNVNDTKYAYEICGSSRGKNCYSIAHEGFDANGANIMTVEDFRSGKVACLLNKGQNATVWHQTIGEDAYPVLDATHGTVYGYYADCEATEYSTYGNSAEGHTEQGHKAVPMEEVPATSTAHGQTGGEKCAYCGEILIEPMATHNYDESGFCTLCNHMDEHPTVAGTGSETDPYQIDNYVKLVWMSKQGYYGQGKYFVLTADIVGNPEVLEYDADGQMSVKSGIDFIEWEPNYFYGILDGQGHSISGLYIDDSSKQDVGLFKWIDERGVVKNIVMRDSYFKCDDYVGSFCYRNDGIISNCASFCLLGAYDDAGRIGGICCYNYGTVEHCYNMCQMNTERYYSYDICSNKASVNCYSLKRNYNYNQNGANIVTEEDFRSGKVAYLLNKGQNATVWYQTLGEDAYPVLNSDSKEVYAVEHKETLYVNEGTTVPEYKLHDGYDFYSPVYFYADHVSYSRTMSNKWGTMVLPFNIDYTKDNGKVQIYYLNEVQESVLVFSQYEDGMIPNGTPVVIKRLTDENTITFEAEDARIFNEAPQPRNAHRTLRVARPEPEEPAWRLLGTYQTENYDVQNADQDRNFYYIASDQFWRATGTIKLNPFRAMFEDFNASNSASSTRYSICEEEDSASGIETLNSNLSEEGTLYDLNGRKADDIKEGKVYMMNGQKVIFK